MLTIRLSKSQWAKACATMIEVGPVRLIRDDPVYEVLPAHLEVLTARIDIRNRANATAQGGEAASWHGR